MLFEVVYHTRLEDRASYKQKNYGIGLVLQTASYVVTYRRAKKNIFNVIYEQEEKWVLFLSRFEPLLRFD